MRRTVGWGLLGALILAAFAALPTAAGAQVQPYGAHNHGVFRNVLPPGEKGVDNLTEALDFLNNGNYPAHWIDQQPLYQNLLYASPTLTNAQIPTYYKDATFGVRPADVESTFSPKPGVMIIRDAGYGIPHIYGATRADTMFGAGYAAAADRLFLMDVLRHTGRASLSSFLGGSNLGSDESIWQTQPYTEADLQRQLNLAAKLYGRAGELAVADVKHYVEGINAYIQAAGSDSSLMPAEYGFINKPLEPWKATDVIATAALIGGIFGRGGGAELSSAGNLQALVDRFGKRAGRRAGLGFREKNDPQAPTTVLHRRFPYETTSAFARRGLALPDRGSVAPAPVARLAGHGVSRTSSPGSAIAGFGQAIQRSLAEGAHASNWELVSARESRTGHPIAVMGPQVGYFVPQILMEEDLHGPGIDARGTAFPGVNLYVQLGHGDRYAWSATSAGADNVDTFAEVLCKDDFHYRYRGKCRAMEKLERNNSWTPNIIDPTPAGSKTLTAFRTVHGIVFARGKVHGRKVAFVSARTTYFHEADSVLGFRDLNDPRSINGPASFKRAASKINFVFNWAYIDRNHIAYYMSGWLPERAPGTSPDFPILGTGQYDWRGYNPRLHTERVLPFGAHPQAVDPPFEVSWNNKQAPGFAAADDNYAFGPLFRSQMISDKVRRGIRGHRKMSLAQLVQAMEEPATQDLRAYKLLPVILRAIGKPTEPSLQGALAELRAWRRAGSHRRDLDRNGTYDDNAAVELMDAWWPKLVAAEFEPALGSPAYKRIRSMLGIGDHTGGAPRAPDFANGWWGYVSKDLRTVFGGRVPGGLGRAYCGGGSRNQCRAALRASLQAALAVTPADLYGHGACAADPQPSCYDQNRSQVTSAISVPPFPFQNRPTFQQTITFKVKSGGH